MAGLMNWTDTQFEQAIRRLSSDQAVPLPKSRVYQPVRGRLNKTEEEYAGELELAKRAGEIEWWAFEPVKLRLAASTFYTPDFGVLRKGRLEMHETKGTFCREDWAVKFKVAAQMYPFLRFLTIRKRRVKDGGGWEVLRDLNAEVGFGRSKA
jgi:hypothetical protein